jgi:RNA polymerase sigma factor (sigma-70 family)
LHKNEEALRISEQESPEGDSVHGAVIANMVVQSEVEAIQVDREASVPRKKSVTNNEVSTDDIFRLYLNDIGKRALLTKEEEIDLAQKIEAGSESAKRLEEESESMSFAERRNAQRLIKTGAEAKNKFFEANLRLVVSVAKRYTKQAQGKLELLDLIQEGNIGLEHAIDKFDWRRGFKFSTYATWWIKQAILRSMANTVNAVRLPVHVYENVARLQRAIYDLEKANIEPTTDALALQLEWSVEKVVEITRCSTVSSPSSLDAPRGNEQDSEYTFQDTIGDVSSKKEYDKVDGNLAMTGLIKALDDVLSEQESQVLKDRYGLVSGEPQSLVQIGYTYSFSREKIRQIETRALTKLRHPSVRNVVGGSGSLI